MELIKTTVDMENETLEITEKNDYAKQTFGYWNLTKEMSKEEIEKELNSWLDKNQTIEYKYN